MKSNYEKYVDFLGKRLFKQIPGPFRFFMCWILFSLNVPCKFFMFFKPKVNGQNKEAFSLKTARKMSKWSRFDNVDFFAGKI